jgi:hypothetical protein
MSNNYTRTEESKQKNVGVTIINKGSAMANREKNSWNGTFG